MIHILTDYPIAKDSPDHTNPHGTSFDNSTNPNFVDEVQNKYGHPIKFLDIGCSGGQLAVDFHLAGNFSVGLEGSDYSIKNKRANWPEYHNKVLFTCDCSRPFFIVNNNGVLIQFDVITAWEVMEHFAGNHLPQAFANIANHLKIGGSFYGSITCLPDGPWHQSVCTESNWRENILLDSGALFETKLVAKEYSLKTSVRLPLQGTGFLLQLDKI